MNIAAIELLSAWFWLGRLMELLRLYGAVAAMLDYSEYRAAFGTSVVASGRNRVGIFRESYRNVCQSGDSEMVLLGQNLCAQKQKLVASDRCQLLVCLVQ